MKLKKINATLFTVIMTLILVKPSISESEEVAPPQTNISSNISINQPITDKKIIIKAVEPIVVHSNEGVAHQIVRARIDTGATQSSIDMDLAKKLGYTKYVGKVNVISANGIKTRPLIEVSYELSGKKIKSVFTLADRSNLNFSVLIGRADLNGFLVDPTD